MMHKDLELKRSLKPVISLSDLSSDNLSLIIFLHQCDELEVS